LSNQQTSQEQNLMLGDRINWPFILGQGVINFQTSIVKVEGEQSEQEVREAALCLYNSIPDAWIKADKAFEEDIKKAVQTRKVDARKEWCGRRVGKPKFEEEDFIDPYKLYHACVNVFHRRGLLSKTIFTEKIVPEPEDFEGKENDGNDTNNQDGR
jgi:hypothetical protein